MKLKKLNKEESYEALRYDGIWGGESSSAKCIITKPKSAEDFSTKRQWPSL